MTPAQAQSGAERHTRMEAEIRRLLNTVGDPCSVANGVPMGLDDMGHVESVDGSPDGDVQIKLRLTSPTCVMVSHFKGQAEELALTVPGVRSVGVSSDIGLDWSPDMMSASAQERRRAALHARGIPAGARRPRVSP